MSTMTTRAPGPTTDRTGFAADFLGPEVHVPLLDPSIADDAVAWEGGDMIPYTHFSLSLSRSRRFARWVAWNIDGSCLMRLSRATGSFTKDPRLPESVQTGNELYAGNRLDRGHLARRADLLWGAMQEAAQANLDSFYYTNISPQMDDFNQSAKNGLWGRLENAVFDDVDVDELRVSVLGGPVFRADDRMYRGTALPREYWKVVVFLEAGVLKSRAFLLSQELDQLRALPDLDEFRVYQIALPDLEQRTQLHFDQLLHDADLPSTATQRGLAARVPLESPADITW